MTKAEYAGNGGCPQRDSTECEGYAGARSAIQPENEERAGRAPGVDGMTVEAALPWLKEHGKESTESIRQGKYKPAPVRRKGIPKPNGGVRKLGIPSVKDRVVQQAAAQKLMPIYEPVFGRELWLPTGKECAGRDLQDTRLRGGWIRMGSPVGPAQVFRHAEP